MSFFLCNFAASNKLGSIYTHLGKDNIMDRPVFREYKTPEERVAAFERWIHLREEWEEHIRQVKAAKQMA